MKASRTTAAPMLDSQELDLLHRLYPIGSIRRMRALPQRWGRCTRIVIEADAGVFFLKKRLADAALLGRLRAVHSLHLHLSHAGFPVPQVVGAGPKRESILKFGDFAYELIRFVEGRPFDRSAADTRAAGRTLADFHAASATFIPILRDHPLLEGRGYHADIAAARRLEGLPEAVGRADPAVAPAEIEPIIRDLAAMRAQAEARVDAVGYREWPETVTHGDWHPGNAVFRSHSVAAVLDLESIRVEPRAADIANGALHFSLQTGSGRFESLHEWPPAPDLGRITAFCRGYDHFDSRYVLSTGEIEALPHLMIEAIICEATAPLAATGRFADVPVPAFLRMVRDKAAAIDKGAVAISRAAAS